MAFTENGEDNIVVCKTCAYAVSLDMASISVPENQNIKVPELRPIKEVETPGVSTVEKVAKFLKVHPKKLVKTIILLADGKEVAVLVRGDYELNLVKLSRYLKTKNLVMADEKTIERITGGPLGFSGPVGLRKIRMLADYSVKNLFNFITGANSLNKHLINVNLNRDFHIEEFGDFRYFTSEDKCPRCGKETSLKTVLEIGHTFKLGTKYSEVLKAHFLDSSGKEKPMIMGCYGIGVNRILAAFVEQNYDKNGIIWNKHICPFQLLIVPAHMEDSRVRDNMVKIYEALGKKGISCLLDDREVSPGVKFKDADLLGIPLRLTIGRRFIDENVLELKVRKTGEVVFFSSGDFLEKILDKIKNLD
ncbi:MAG: His/Gly/Thr/Pro-type tRNA ligase C-terminal domain-containing protein [Candidatus Omnitrophica bacterium]|nr:His/Gly/Thr/Pro-type tRNA ligase C-terminal domain-containing protein [Candidatus Omnitrophota bacterium]